MLRCTISDGVWCIRKQVGWGSSSVGPRAAGGYGTGRTTAAPLLQASVVFAGCFKERNRSGLAQ
jgi:hypothetical protein